MKRISILASCVLATLLSFGQTNLVELQPESWKENVTVERLCHEEHQSCYSIWVSDTVKPHYHANHTETIYVVKGGGIFYLGDQSYNLKPGDFVTIPKGAIHSFKNKGDDRTQVLSVQAPKFEGKDRIWVDKQE